MVWNLVTKFKTTYITVKKWFRSRLINTLNSIHIHCKEVQYIKVEPSRFCNIMKLNGVVLKLHAPMFIQFSARTSTLHFLSPFYFPIHYIRAKKKLSQKFKHKQQNFLLASADFLRKLLVLHYHILTAPFPCIWLLFSFIPTHCFSFFFSLLKAWNIHVFSPEHIVFVLRFFLYICPLFGYKFSNILL